MLKVASENYTPQLLPNPKVTTSLLLGLIYHLYNVTQSAALNLCLTLSMLTSSVSIFLWLRIISTVEKPHMALTL